MADPLIPGLDANVLAGALGGVGDAVAWILGIAILGGLAWLWQYYMQFKIDCTIESLIDGTAIVRSDKIRQFNDKGVPKWQIWGGLFRFKKKKLAIPKDKFLKVRSNGKKYVTLFETPTGDYLVVKSSADLVRQIATYDEFTTQQRQMIIQEYREAAAYKPTDWMQHIPAIAGMTALVIIVTVFMLFFGDTMQPIITGADKYFNALREHDDKILQIAASQERTAEIMARILSNIDPAYLQELQAKALANITGSNTSAYVAPPN